MTTSKSSKAQKNRGLEYVQVHRFKENLLKSRIDLLEKIHTKKMSDCHGCLCSLFMGMLTRNFSILYFFSCTETFKR